jgi:hypothetical protein
LEIVSRRAHGSTPWAGSRERVTRLTAHILPTEMKANEVGGNGNGSPLLETERRNAGKGR